MNRFVSVIVLIAMFGFTGCQPSEEKSIPQSEMSAVRTIEPALRSGPSIEIAEKEIDLGVIPSEAGEIVGSVLFYNNGSGPLQVQKVTGPCSCFAGYSGDKLLQPQEGGELQVRFNKSKIPSGRVKRLAKIMTNDPENETVEVYFNFTVQRNPVEEEIRKLREEFSKLRKELHAVRHDLKKVTAELKAAVPKSQSAKPKAARQPDTTIHNVNIGSSPTLGPKDAQITIVEFVDFQCPFCTREYPKIKKVLQDYPDKIRFVFKHYPLSMHKKAKPVHAATELARQEGGPETFWKMHDMIIANPKQLEIANLRGYTESLGLNLTKFDELIADEDKIDELLKADMSEASKCNVRGTPTVLINGLRLSGRGIEDYKARIDKILSENTKK